jgi:predicted AlkP superfamily phosphohydrolase/phosphomutase
MKRRDFIRAAAAGALASSGGASLLLNACGGPAYKETDRKLIVLAFDGLDPIVLERFMTNGRLPNFAKLAAKSGIQTLETTTPAESAAAWVSLSTGLPPDDHGAFTSVARRPEDCSLYRLPVEHRRGNWWPPWDSAAYESTNAVKAPAFWETAAMSGIRTVALRVPYDVPPPYVPGSFYLGGPGVPDATLGDGRYHFLSTNSKEAYREDTILGGFAGVLEIAGKDGRGTLFGPPGAGGEPAELPFDFTVQNAQIVDVLINGARTSLTSGVVSDPIPMTFSVGRDEVSASASFYLISAEPEVRIYVSPASFRPAESVYRMSRPGDWAAELLENYGLYRTAGRAFDTLGLADGATLKNVFAENFLRISAERRKQLLAVLADYSWNLFFHFDDSIEQIQHIFYRYAEADPKDPGIFLAFGDLLHKAYELADEALGDVLNGVMQANADVVVLSAYGCSGVERWFDPNAWLRENGYLSLYKNPKELRPIFAYNDTRYFGRAFDGVDWSKTQAYSCGPGLVYLNRRGREGQGITETGDALKDEIAKRLVDVKHEGKRVCAAVESGEKVFPQLADETRPDMVVSVEPGYQVAGASKLGLTGPSVIVENDTFWTGGHSTVDPSAVPGVFATTADAGKPNKITDAASLILNYFGL